MSIQQIQTKNFLEFIVSSYLASGKKPNDEELAAALSNFFSQQPAGSPVRVDIDSFRRGPKSNVDDFNDFLAAVQVNLSTLFEAVDEHGQQNILLTTALLTQLKVLRTRRNRLNEQVDSILLASYNTDGYYFSVSDDFFDGDFVDFSYTTAIIDVDSDTVTLPSTASGTRLLDLSNINTPAIQCRDRKDSTKELAYDVKSGFDSAIDGLSNTAWYLTVERIEPSDGVVVSLDFELGSRADGVNVSRLNLVPHGIKPVQCSVEKYSATGSQTGSREVFSSYIKDSSDKMIFNNDDPTKDLFSLRINMKKDLPDYFEDNIDGSRTGIYIFGIKEMSLVSQSYELKSSLVSIPLGLASDIADVDSIDAVTLSVIDSQPIDTSIEYYIAPDNPEATSVEDFQWQRVDTTNQKNGLNVISFDGATLSSKMIRSEARNIEDLSLIAINRDTSDIEIKNPTDAYFSNFDTYRICAFPNEFVSRTIKLEEGLNTTRIYHTDYSYRNLSDTFNFWKENLDDPDSYIATYGTIDSGNEFFYGADIGDNERSVYVETLIFSEDDQKVSLENVVKSNPNSKLWDLKLFLNGRLIADMPKGLDKINAPVKLNKGKNSIVLVVDIPAASEVSSVPYIGSVAFRAQDFGLVKLSDLVYVDIHKFQDGGYRDLTNVSPNKWFTIYNDEIITRSRTTDNYRISYSSKTDGGPDSVRVRAELSRSSKAKNLTPMIDSYRIKFSYKDSGQ
jgi:hypothetical protein